MTAFWPLRAALVLLLAGCALPSEEEVKDEFEAYVRSANACEQASECVLVSPGCPLGCFVAVRADRKADVERKARELIARYERGGRACAYGCAEPGPIACVERRCAFGPPP